MRGYVVVFEGDDESGYSAYSPDLPGVVAAGSSREETEILMRQAMVEHIALLVETGQPVPEPATSAQATIMNIAAAWSVSTLTNPTRPDRESGARKRIG